jgi:uncharacterized Ntn-hydrolase superfamily protein
MTFSIVAHAEESDSWGVAVASKFLSVGAYVPAAVAGVGAIATQSYANLAFRSTGHALMAAGCNAQQALDAMVGADELREQRQVGVVDAHGGSSTFTGAECNPWAGGRAGDGYAIQGNILVGPEVVDIMEKAWIESGDDPVLARRLLKALTAGDSVGGDRRGRQSAALLVVSPAAGYGGGNDVLCDLRVDDHSRPVEELARLLDLHDLYFGTSDPEELLALEGALLSEVSGLLAKVGFAPAGDTASAVRNSLWNWAGVENLEERVPELPLIDPVVLRELKKHASA